jgi:hypothetical protein
MFYDVQYMDLPSTLPNLEIGESSNNDIAFAKSRIGEAVSEYQILVLKSNNHRYLVVAGNATFAESSMDLFESPLKTLPPIKLRERK